jgi:NAD(P)-dependent dehydrogenase (short-subunit alcohol dehydrogenase family)
MAHGRPVVLVTGSAKRVGRVIALQLAEAGYDLALHCRSSLAEADETASLVAAKGARAEIFQADLGDESACKALVPAVVKRMRRLDAVVNNASSFGYDAPGSFSFELMDSMMRANCGSAIVLAQALYGHLNERCETGCVVNLLDQKLWNQNPDYFSYTLSKAALESANTMLAMALAPQVRVCGVAPGLTLPSGPMNDREFAQAQRLTPLHRASTPEDVARAVRFLLESPAITGTTLLVDGGQHLSGQPRDVLFLAQQAQQSRNPSTPLSNAS